MKYFKYLAFLLMFTAIPVFAVQVTVPSAPTSGYFLVSTSTGNYIATTTSPAHFSSVFATSSTDTSFFNGIVKIAGNFFLTPFGAGALYTSSSGQVLTHATTSSSVAYQDVWRDANQNAFAQNFVSAATSFPTNGGTVTLTSASPRTWVFTGTNTETMKLPSGTTLSVGAIYTANNNSTLVVTVVDNGSNTLAVVPSGGKIEFVIYDTGTTNGSWDAHALLGHNNVSGTGTLGVSSTTPTFSLSVGSSNTGTFGISTTTDGCPQFTKGLLWITSCGISSYDAWSHPQVGFSATTSALVISTSTAPVNISALTISSTTASQLGLFAGSGKAGWVVRSAGGNLYISTTTTAGTATTSTSALSIDGTTGIANIPSGVSVNGSIAGNLSFTAIGSLNADIGAKYINASGAASAYANNYFENDLGKNGFVGIGSSGNSLEGFNSRIFLDDDGANGLSLISTGGNDIRFYTGTSGTAGVRMLVNNNGIGIATTTFNNYQLTIASSTAPQLSLSAGVGLAQWIARNAGGNLYFSTTTVAGTSTTTQSAFWINGSTGGITIGTTTAGCLKNDATGLIFSATCSGAGTVTSVIAGAGFQNQGLNITSSGTLVGAIATSATPTLGNLSYWTGTGNASTPAKLGTVATSSASCSSGISCSSFTVVGGISPSITLTAPVTVALGGTNKTSYPINSIITSDSAGTSLIATGTQLTVGNLIATTSATSLFSGKLGLSTTTPFAQFSINTTAATWPFIIGSSTGSYLGVNDFGSITLNATQPSTTTTITLDWSKTGPQVEYQIGTSGTTITLINATTSTYWGTTKRVWVCNPGSTAGAVTWVGVEWIGTAPTQTTTANQCDLWSFDVTRATSTSAYKVAGGANTGFQ